MSSTDLVAEFFTHLDAGDVDWVKDRLTADCHIIAPGFEQVGDELAMMWLSSFYVSFPDITHRPYRVVATGDEVAFLMHVVGTHTADLHLPTGDVVPPTGRTLDITAAEFWQCTDGQISEYRVIYDQAEFLAQLGLLA
jgi:ketosteroid isomerase-like protein